MSYDEMLKKLRSCKSIRSRPSDEEHRLQRACVRWFNLEYPHLRVRLLEGGAEIIIRLAILPREADKARQMRQMSRKLRKKSK